MTDADFGSKEAASLGGKARAKSLSKEERSEQGRNAVTARWERQGKLKNKIVPATHGDPDHPLRIGDLEIPCYVLADGRRVLHQRGMVQSLGLARGSSGGTGGDRLAKFVAGDRLKAFVNNHLRDVTQTPIKFSTPTGQIAYGYEATVLADICEAVLAARKERVLQKQQEHIANQCEVLVRGFARVGIVALVDEATGFQEDRDRYALAKILEAFVAKELRKWVPTFQADFFRELFRLKNLKFNGTIKSPPFVGHIINDIVYARLAPGVLAELKRKNPTTETGRRKHKHFQWLTENTGHPKLKEHLASVTTMMKMSDDWDTFYAWLERIHKKWIELPLWTSAGVVPQDLSPSASASRQLPAQKS